MPAECGAEELVVLHGGEAEGAIVLVTVCAMDGVPDGGTGVSWTVCEEELRVASGIADLEPAGMETTFRPCPRKINRDHDTFFCYRCEFVVRDARSANSSFARL